MIFLLLLFGFGLLLTICWLWSLIDFGVAKAHQRTEIAREAGRRLVWLSGVAVLLVALGWFWFSPPARVVYQRELGENPSSDVTHLQADDESYYDSTVVKLRFQAAPSTIRRLTKLKGLRLTSRSERRAYEIDNNDAPPEWWQPKITARAWAYSSKSKSEDAFSEDVWLLYDPQTRTAYYSHSGVY